MKNYLAIQDLKPKKDRIHLTIYRIKDDEIHRVSILSYNQWSHRGREIEIATALAEAGEIPIKFADRDIMSWVQSSEFFKVNIIEPKFIGDIASDAAQGKLNIKDCTITNT